MKRLSLVSLMTILLLSFMIGIVSAGQTVTVPCASFNSATEVEYNFVDINGTWQLELFENVTWIATKHGNITFYDLSDATNYIVLEVNGTHVIVSDEDEKVLFSATEYTEYIYLNSYTTYFKLKTDVATTWATKSHDNFGVKKFGVLGGVGSATEDGGNCKLTLSSGAGVIDVSLIESIIPIIVTMAVISMVVKMLTKMTDKMSKL